MMRIGSNASTCLIAFQTQEFVTEDQTAMINRMKRIKVRSCFLSVHVVSIDTTVYTKQVV